MTFALTKKEAFEQIIAILTEEERDEVLINMMKHEIELLNKKKNKADAERTAINEAIAAQICEVLADGVARRCDDIRKSIEDDSVSTNKVSAVLRSLIADNKVKRGETKGVAYFSLIQ